MSYAYMYTCLVLKEIVTAMRERYKESKEIDDPARKLITIDDLKGELDFLFTALNDNSELKEQGFEFE